MRDKKMFEKNALLPRGRARDKGVMYFNVLSYEKLVAPGRGEPECHAGSPVIPPVYLFIFPGLKPFTKRIKNKLGGEKSLW